MSFLIQVTPIPHNDMYHLDTSIFIQGLKIPKGFTWDGASIPRTFWTIIGSPFQPKFMAPSMVHDYLYGNHDGQDGNPLFTRKGADILFKRLLIANGVGDNVADTMYDAVRLGGKSSWVV